MIPVPVTDEEARAIVLAVVADLDTRRDGSVSKTVLVDVDKFPWSKARVALFNILNTRQGT